MKMERDMPKVEESKQGWGVREMEKRGEKRKGGGVREGLPRSSARRFINSFCMHRIEAWIFLLKTIYYHIAPINISMSYIILIQLYIELLPKGHCSSNQTFY